MSNVIIQAVKIKINPIPAGLTEHAELGLYIGATAELRWSEYPLVGVADVWKGGIIANNGIGDRTREMDTRRGGAVESYSGLDLTVLNNNNLILRLKELGVNLNGLTAELWEFEGTDIDSDATSATLLFAGIIKARMENKNKKHAFKTQCFYGNVHFKRSCQR